jgi:subtilase-type serine protease
MVRMAPDRMRTHLVLASNSNSNLLGDAPKSIRLQTSTRPLPFVATLLLSTALASVAQPLHAASLNWTGGVSNDWYTGGNWSGGAAPGSGDAVDISTMSPNGAVINGGTANASSVSIGTTGSGDLLINNGATFNSTGGSIGAAAGFTGTVSVSGNNSQWVNQGDVTVGGSGQGHLNITNGTVSDQHASVGQNTGVIGTVSVDGATGSAIGNWINNNGLDLGVSGTGQLSITNGGVVSSANNTNLGLNSTGSGKITIDGTGSKYSAPDLFVGSQGSALITVRNGGSLYSFNSTIGDHAGSTGSVQVLDTGSNWLNPNDLIVGNAGTGGLAVTNGGSVTSNTGTIGNMAGSDGAVGVGGVGSGGTWTVWNALTVGESGTGLLIVSTGGTVTSTLGIVGDHGSGTALLGGPGASWTASQNIVVGVNAGATGTMTIFQGATVSTPGALTLASQANSSGTLNIGMAPGTAPDAPGTLNAAGVQFGAGTGVINFNHTDSNYVFAAPISGSGTINQLTGVTSLTGDSSGFTGGTFITGGRLAVNGSLSGSTVTVSGGGILGGNGTVGGIVAQNGGIVGPGNSIGTLVAGNVSFASGSIYQVEVNAAGQSDKIAALGNATINGGTVQVLAGTGAYSPTTTYTILTANGGRTGTFNSVTSNFVFLDPSLSYDAKNVYLTLSVNDTNFQSVGVTRNQIATAGGIQSGGGGNAVYDGVLSLSAAQARTAFDQLSGEIHASTKGVMIEDSRFPREAAINRLREAFAAVGTGTGPFNAYAADSRQAGDGPATTNQFAVWGSAFGSWGTFNSDGNAATISRDIGGFVTGIDQRAFDTWRVGLLGGYSHSTYAVGDRRSSGTSDDYHIGLYGGTEWSNIAFRSGAIYTWHDVYTNRTVAFPGFSDLLRDSGSGAYTAQVFGEFGYRIDAVRTPVGALSYEPFANIAYVSLSTNHFTETGGPAALSGLADTSGVTFTTLGLRASGDVALGNGMTMTARGTVGWKHAFGDTTPLATLLFAGGSPFTVAGVPIAQDAAVIDAGVDVRVAPNATVGLSYGGQFGSGLTDQTVRGTFNAKF